MTIERQRTAGSRVWGLGSLGTAALKEHGAAVMVWDMGTGKTACSLAVARPFCGGTRILVVCPPHLVEKWQREARWLIPNVDARIIRSVQDLDAFARDAKTSTRPMVAVLSRGAAGPGRGRDAQLHSQVWRGGCRHSGGASDTSNPQTFTIRVE